MSDAGPTQQPLAGLHILLVEDDPLIALDLEASFQDLGAEVSATPDVSVALDKLRSFQPDFAVLDFELGNSTSEPVAEFLKSRGVPFVFLSGYGERDERFTRWPGSAVMVKPVSIATVAEHIRRALGREPA